jgi:hypothetical protein
MTKEYVVPLIYAPYVRMSKGALVILQIWIDLSNHFTNLRSHSSLVSQSHLLKVILDKPFKHRNI